MLTSYDEMLYHFKFADLSLDEDMLIFPWENEVYDS